jgi:hypothetical protein
MLQLLSLCNEYKVGWFTEPIRRLGEETNLLPLLGIEF